MITLTAQTQNKLGTRFAPLFDDSNSKEARTLVANMTDFQFMNPTEVKTWEAIEVALEGQTKETRIEAKRAARAELAQWIADYFETGGEGNDVEIASTFALRYHLRVAELAGISL